MANANAINSGVPGTAITKTASDNSLAVVASISGAITTGNIAAFADILGTLKDGGLFYNQVVKQWVLTTGLYTPTSGMQFCIIELWGAGGGGGGAQGTAAQVAAASGGSSGGYCALLTDAATIGASQAVTIGAAGAGGTAGNNDGAAGGDSEIAGLTLTAGGGGGGIGGATSTTNTMTLATNAGGTATGGTINVPGRMGGAGLALIAGLGASIQGGDGGAGILGCRRTGRGDAVGQAGFGPAGGGGGAAAVATDRAGGNGAVGVCIITEFVLA